MLIRQITVLLLAAAMCPVALQAQSAAQAFQKAPAGVEEALRERVKAFYALQKEGKFRQSEPMLCEDSKDVYYDSDKRRWTSVEIVRVTFENDFQEAKVLVALGTEMQQRGQRVPATFPFNASWKLQSGQWCHHIPPPNKEKTITPFGIMQQTEGAAGAKQAPVIPPSPQAAMASILSSIKFSKRELKVKGYEKSSDELEIYNGMPGPMQVGVNGVAIPGLKWHLTKSDLQGGERTLLKLDYEPPDKSPKSTMKIVVILEPLGLQGPVNIVFDIPESVKQQLPPAVRP